MFNYFGVVQAVPPKTKIYNFPNLWLEIRGL